MTLDVASEVALEIMLETACGLTPDKSRCCSWVWIWGGAGAQCWSQLQKLVEKQHHNWQRHKHSALSAVLIHPGDFNNAGFIPSLIPSEFVVRNSH